MVDYTDRVAIVTGAGGGLGRSHAMLLASLGAAVVVNDLGGTVHGEGSSQTAADAVVAEIEAAGGVAVADYSSVAAPDSAAALVEHAMDEFGRVDVLINNAGILRDRSIVNLSTDELDAVLDVHLRGAFYVTQPAFRIMKERGIHEEPIHQMVRLFREHIGPGQQPALDDEGRIRLETTNSALRSRKKSVGPGER